MHSFRGPAPLHHILLSGCKTVGITLQTLHRKHFDHGTILAQTSYPGFDHKATNVSQLEALVTPKAAEMLVLGIKDRIFVPPLLDVGWYEHTQQLVDLRHAPKITTEDRHIDWKNWTAEEILRRHQIIGPLWSFAQGSNEGKAHRKRIIWTTGFSKVHCDGTAFQSPGHPFLKTIGATGQNLQILLLHTCDGYLLQVNEAKIEGGRVGRIAAASKRAGMVDDNLPQSSPRFRSHLE